VAALIPPATKAAAVDSGRLPFAFGRRFFLFLFAGFVWIVAAWQQPRFLLGLVLWDAMALFLWVWDLSQLPKPSQLEVKRSWSRPLGLSTPGLVGITVQNRSSQGITAEIVDEAPASLVAQLPKMQVVARAKSEGAATYAIEPRARGDLRFGAAWLRYQSRFKFAERWAKADIGQTVRVYPSIERAGHLEMYLIRSRQIEMEKRLKRQRGRSREFESLRDYREGDEWRDICWSVTARRGKLVTKLYEVERSQTVWIVLDAGRLLRTRANRLTKLDYATNAALDLAQVALYSGDRVALLAYGRKPQQRVAPGRGRAQLRVLLESLAQVRNETLEADHFLAAEMLMSMQSRRSLVVWLTDLAETPATPDVVECAARMASRHLVLLGVIGQPELPQLVAAGPKDAQEMYRYVAAVEVAQRRELILRRLRQQGALTFEVGPTQVSTAVVNRYLEVKERSLL
jgi:uncharacterized protein (DUF58 family)